MEGLLDVFEFEMVWLGWLGTVKKSNRQLDNESSLCYSQDEGRVSYGNSDCRP
jgi:hypothetical protein